MDAATLQSRIYAGYGKAATRIGYMTDVYRPYNQFNPLSLGNKIASIPASFNAEDMKYSKPNKYGHPTWFGVFDGSGVAVGDYLDNAHDGTFFVAAQQTALPILLVQTNRILTIKRPQQQTGLGAVSYGGDTDAGETALMTAWPASVLQGSKADKTDVLPGDYRSREWIILLPAVSGVTLRTDDIITDDLARRFVISAAELTDLGWRLLGAQVQT